MLLRDGIHGQSVLARIDCAGDFWGIGSKDYAVHTVDCGHIGIYVSRRAQENIPARIISWLKERGQRELEQGRAPGGTKVVHVTAAISMFGARCGGTDRESWTCLPIEAGTRLRRIPGVRHQPQ
jgi:hypothetical protein